MFENEIIKYIILLINKKWLDNRTDKRKLKKDS